MRFRALLYLAATLFFYPLSARADLIGDNIHVYENNPMQATTKDLGSIFAPGSGSNALLGFVTYEVTGDQISLLFNVPKSFYLESRSFTFVDTSKDPWMDLVSMDAQSTPLFGQDGSVNQPRPPIITFDTSSVTFTFGDVVIPPGSKEIFDLDFRDPVSATPEPASLLLVGSAVLGVLGMGRRRFFAR
ncbi:PEP-CTERM sorting domain-containing protein [Terriglobus saanensis]|uniref:Uncharacterized protein n=1 Tax=Terriglobus saanensis (strain ATCC BAA-1853 / DSM 23119 / SP1PR4) TaxID=401053 RepID=E8V4H5_TERSS|nr:PEP-CTERM sorting domain-containing protein [Terriglobus saanensis]ADV84799.1 protein of unknown function DUF1555 [Terriglobus saanensis SP1PR4]